MKTTKQPTRYRVTLREKDLRRDTFRAGGPGGQHQNKTESAVRYTHIPTGVFAESRSDRSQHVNDELARAALEEKLLRLYLLQRGQSIRDAWQRKPEIAFGAQTRSYVLAGDRRVIDHETGWKGDPKRVLEGDIDEMLRARLMHAREIEEQMAVGA